MADATRVVNEDVACLIECRGLGKDYRMGNNVVHALIDVNVRIDTGEFVAIMGPSGSGKSTFMNLIGALDSPSHGELYIASRNIGSLNSDQQARLRNETLGFVFQQFMLLPRTTALENTKLPLMYTPLGRAEKDARAIAALKRVGLAERMDHHPSQLSGGQQQRVAIARALVNRPRMLLADEPTGALDTETGEDIMRLFTDLNAEGTTVILVTHEQEIADYAERIIRFRDGRLIEDSQRGREE